VLIEASLDFPGDPEAVWGRLSDVERIPEYWHGTKALKVLDRQGGKVVADARFAFGGSGRVEISADPASKTLLQRFLSGPFTGTQTVRVVGNRLEARWDIEFHGLLKIGSGRTAGHFRSGTVHALERLSSGGEAELAGHRTHA
jgi:uncharacterized protein YndB with AHSA1/START domain